MIDLHNWDRLCSLWGTHWGQRQFLHWRQWGTS